MSTTKKVLAIIFSVLFIGAFAFVLTWGIINFNKVKDGMSGTGLYTAVANTEPALISALSRT